MKQSDFRSKQLMIYSLLLLLLLLLTGCGGSDDSPDTYVGQTITSLKEEDTDTFSLLLEDGIAESNDLYVLQFPEELREPYQKFLQTTFKTISFEVNSAKKTSNGYKVQVSYTPVHIANTLKEADNEYLSSLQSADFAAEAAKMLKHAENVLTESPVYNEKTLYSVVVTEDDDGYTITDDSLKAFLNSALYSYMTPYNDICAVYDNLDYFQAYLDALYKGEIEQYAKQTNQTEEEAQAWYEMDTFDPPSDLSAAYVDRYKVALKTIMKQCKYTLGAPQIAAGNVNYTSMDYKVKVTYSPNTSLVNAYREFESGTYYSIDEASSGLVQAMEKYAASPTFDPETSMTVTVSPSSFMSIAQEDSELYTLTNAIFPWPE